MYSIDNTSIGYQSFGGIAASLLFGDICRVEISGWNYAQSDLMNTNCGTRRARTGLVQLFVS